ncbi:MAG: phenylalanine--tRNA ligase subunit beta [bacterium]|nr:phenylalanine--tRNA ligase subunit beta [bacterium]
MYVSYRWLSRHVDLTGIAPEQLAEDLTLSTAEVEGLEPFAAHLSDVTVGLVTERKQHEGADKLSVCTVDVGAGEPLQIVCGAPNVDSGQKVAVATVGTVLPGDFKIKKSKIRGVESRGMICSVRELDLGDEHDGIWVLPEGCEVGSPVREALGLDDWVIEIDNKSLTHRPDLWGHRGLAGEIAAIYERELKPFDCSLPNVGGGTSYPLRVDSPDCPRYIGLTIEGAQPLASPDWLRFLLLAVGQRPIDQLVDVSNFVMLDLGQPNHTFDLERLSPEGITVRNARAGEKMTTLDGGEHELIPADLLICSADEPVALAGVMGGEGSKVAEGTQSLLLEVANFAPAVVRRTAMRLGLRTDASARFEKSLDPNLAMSAAGHFARTLVGLQPDVRFPAPPSDVGDWHDPAHTITLSCDRVRSVLGTDLADGEIAKILTRLRFDVEGEGGALRVGIPAARATKDIGIEQDLIEEVGRIHRYANLPERLLRADVKPPPHVPRRVIVRKIQDRLAGAARFHEVLSYSFVDDELLAKVGQAEAPHVQLVNPVIESQSRIRRDVLPSLLARLENNRRHREDVRLFEIGKGYRPENGNERGEPDQVHSLALAWAAPRPGKKARFDENAFSRLYGVVDDLFGYLGVARPCWGADLDAPAWAHPARRLGAFWGTDEAPGAVLAELEPGLARALGLEGELASDVAVCEISIDRLLALEPRGSGYVPIPRYPGVKVDVALLVGADAQAAQLVDAIEKAGKGAVSGVELFDLYRGENLGAGKKSLAYHVLLQSPNKTLSDKDVAKFLGRLERAVTDLGGELRKG